MSYRLSLTRSSKLDRSERGAATAASVSTSGRSLPAAAAAAAGGGGGGGGGAAAAAVVVVTAAAGTGGGVCDSDVFCCCPAPLSAFWVILDVEAAAEWPPSTFTVVVDIAWSGRSGPTVGALDLPSSDAASVSFGGGGGGGGGGGARPVSGWGGKSPVFLAAPDGPP